MSNWISKIKPTSSEFESQHVSQIISKIKTVHSITLLFLLLLLPLFNNILTVSSPPLFQNDQIKKTLICIANQYISAQRKDSTTFANTILQVFRTEGSNVVVSSLMNDISQYIFQSNSVRNQIVSFVKTIRASTIPDILSAPTYFTILQLFARFSEVGIHSRCFLSSPPSFPHFNQKSEKNHTSTYHLAIVCDDTNK